MNKTEKLVLDLLKNDKHIYDILAKTIIEKFYKINKFFYRFTNYLGGKDKYNQYSDKELDTLIEQKQKEWGFH